jgi:ABC-type nickel/cobalt efflux system permease component RcnA
MNMELDFLAICSAVSVVFVSSLSDALWTGIRYLWPWYGFLIVLTLGTWIFWEIHTRFTTTSFRSQNGFTPTFNRFVGSGTYLGLQTLTFLVLSTAFGNLVYCLKWPLGLHALVFLSSGLLLKYIGFWVYLKETGLKRRKYHKRHY